MSLSRHEIHLLSLLRDRTWVFAGGRMVKTTARLIDKGLLETRGRERSATGSGRLVRRGQVRISPQGLEALEKHE